eukprot:6640595-Alexandrium_andersonii.AAC.1
MMYSCFEWGCVGHIAQWSRWRRTCQAQVCAGVASWSAQPSTLVRARAQGRTSLRAARVGDRRGRRFGVLQELGFVVRWLQRLQSCA